MKAAVIDSPGAAIRIGERDVPEPAPGEIRIRVRACGVCRTDLHILDGDLPPHRVPLIPGHQIAGVVDAVGEGVTRFRAGDRAGASWLGWSCGACEYCLSGRENLCAGARFTGYDRDGGFAEVAIVDAAFAIPLPDRDPVALAPFLCAGLIGFRAYRMAGEARRLGLYGFGSAAHLLAQIARHQGREVYAFTREGDAASRALALGLGATWAGSSAGPAPVPLDAAIIFAPAGELVPLALRAVAPGGSVICAGIHMTAIPSFPYELLWGERTLRSVANLTRDDARAFFDAIRDIPLEARVTEYGLEDVGRALEDLRAGRVSGSAVVVVSRDR
ncbi:MAG TPA: zinc-dependent alcohol dehydrogenase family protein [Thermoanaerobaculia bacterium]|nr:zinc-dependent alcohol dehydrogenase family protein [Thermoanaerobaculia bacterium]